MLNAIRLNLCLELVTAAKDAFVYGLLSFRFLLFQVCNDFSALAQLDVITGAAVIVVRRENVWIHLVAICLTDFVASASIDPLIISQLRYYRVNLQTLQELSNRLLFAMFYVDLYFFNIIIMIETMSANSLHARLIRAIHDGYRSCLLEATEGRTGQVWNFSYIALVSVDEVVTGQKYSAEIYGNSISAFSSQHTPSVLFLPLRWPRRQAPAGLRNFQIGNNRDRIERLKSSSYLAPCNVLTPQIF